MLLNKQSTSNYQLVELLVPANSPNQRFNFADQPLLRDKAVEKIEWYFNQFVNRAPSGTANNTAANTNVYVTFADQSGFEFIQNIPIWELQALGDSTVNNYNTKNGTFNIGLRKIVFPKSYITYNITSPVVIPYSILFGIYYK